MNLANFICKSDYSAGQAFIVVVLSMVFIFSVLVFLMGIMHLTPIILKKFQAKGLKVNKNEQIETVQSENEGEEIVAAITAAITYLRQEENVRAPFVIKKIKPN